MRHFFLYIREHIIVYTIKTIGTFVGRIFVGGIVLFALIFIIMIFVARGSDGASEGGSSIIYPEYSYTYVFGDQEAAKYLVSIPIEGVILGKRSAESPFAGFEASVTYGYEVKRMLYDLAEDADTYGIILEINSPGGTIFGAQAVVDGIRYYKEKNPTKPVYAVIVGMGASGGYRIAAAADKVYADHGSLVGSIGVIAGPFTYYKDVVEENGGLLMGGVTSTQGIDHEYITAGKGKDIGNPYRPMTVEEKNVMQEGVDSLYDQFVTHIATSRTLEKKDIIDTIGAYPYDSIEAKKLGLIDDIASIESVYDMVAETANIETYQVIQVEKFINPFQELFLSVQTLFTNKTIQTPFTDICSHAALGLVYYGDIQRVCK